MRTGSSLFNSVTHADATPDVATVREFLLGLQQAVCQQLEQVELAAGGDAIFISDHWQRPEGGGGISCVLQGGKGIEKAGVMFSHINIAHLPASATERHPHIAGCMAEAIGVSVVVHPTNPHAPTSHANIRLFVARPEQGPAVWWMGGGFDLTPIYGYSEDCIDWHTFAKNACMPFGDAIYAYYKKWCDEYFTIKHRQEPRGIGGLFYDDLNTGDFAQCFAFMRAVGQSYLQAIVPILHKRIHTPYTAEQRDFQLYRRGRYVEYNLIYDRGTLFGLQSNGRVESILVSLPNMVSWHYAREYDADSAEARLLTEYLINKDWVAL